LVDRIPPALDAAVMMALAKNPARRHPDAQVFARALAKALPAAHDVDSGALSALLLGTMEEHRTRQKATYPEGVYERLEQQIETLRMGGAEPAQPGEQPALQKYTLENTAPYGSEAASLRQRARAEPAPRAAEITASEGAPRSAGRDVAAGSVRPFPAHEQPRDLRQRRLVRLADELRTTFTAIENELLGKHGTWVAVAAAVGLAFALALITAVLRSPPRRPPPALPSAASAHVPPPPPPPERKAPVPSLPRELGAAGVPSEASALQRHPAAGERDTRTQGAEPSGRAASKRLPTLGTADGTPLFTEPGF
jgi:hypothetical protein